ncbi:HEPN domain-containing protein [Pontibacter sp. G13]|uniref:HEPN domain-containing protein n=1 Tax=Pontibacter sp. G13 TaxID=3074898 RepID=UPI00288C0EE5|nr:HEPN domain-containing protein [Pontibacter sp. G13]WNJ20703.1 HEPN domain-containing protein [Pontibacter sp. G13]
MTHFDQTEYVKYRMKKAREALSAAHLLAEHQQWNACINRLYYGCFYAVTALLISQDIHAKSHAGVKTQFFQHFLKSGQIEKSFGLLYADLFDWRQRGDYGDFFDFEAETVEPVLPQVEAFLTVIQKLL